MNVRETAMRLAYALDLSEADMYAVLTSTGVAPLDQEDR